MGISSAMQTGVSGLFANSTAVGKISENIANANTVGYKRGFAQMVTTTAGGSVTSSGVRAVLGSTVSQGGTFSSTSSATDLSVSGNGFFVVSRNPNDPVQANYMLTRAGSFLPDANGDLVNAAGYYLAGFPFGEDGTIGAVDRNGFGQMQTVNIRQSGMTAAPTTAASLAGNLPSQETGLATPGAAFVSSMEYFTPLGASQRISLAWQPADVANQWTVSFTGSDGTAYGSVDVTFADSGPDAGSPLLYDNITAIAPGFGFDPATGVATLSIANGGVPQVLDLMLGAPGSFDGVTQFAGDFTPQDFVVDGSSVAVLNRVEIDRSGTVWGVFDNGIRRALFEIPVATVTNPEGMVAVDGNAWRLSRNSGDLAVATAGTGNAGAITAGSLEGSNVEIAQELTDLIRTQRAYSSNAKVITTADEMLDETTRLKR